MSAAPLLTLVEQLKVCSTANTQITAKRLSATWGCFREINLEHGDTVTPAIMAGVILHDTDTFAPLLTQAELAQLQTLAQSALDRYLQLTNPPNPVGKTIAAILKGEL